MSHKEYFTEELASCIDAFLMADEKDQYWRAIELHEELVGPGDERILEVKAILERGVDTRVYERKIFEKGKKISIGYQARRVQLPTVSKADGGMAESTTSDMEELEWERTKK